jgi:hypothetical protein
MISDPAGTVIVRSLRIPGIRVAVILASVSAASVEPPALEESGVDADSDVPAGLPCADMLNVTYSDDEEASSDRGLVLWYCK